MVCEGSIDNDVVFTRSSPQCIKVVESVEDNRVDVFLLKDICLRSLADKG